MDQGNHTTQVLIAMPALQIIDGRPKTPVMEKEEGYRKGGVEKWSKEENGGGKYEFNWFSHTKQVYFFFLLLN